VATRFEGSECEKLALDLMVKLTRASSSVESVAARSLIGTHLTLSQFGVLDALYHLGDMTLGTLAVKHLRSPNNMTSVIGTMERSGLVRRVRQECDRRTIVVSLTDKGRAAFEAVWPRHLESIEGAMSGVTAEEKVQLASLLKKLGLAAAEVK